MWSSLCCTHTTGTSSRRARSTRVETLATTASRSCAPPTTPFWTSTTSSAVFGRFSSVAMAGRYLGGSPDRGSAGHPQISPLGRIKSPPRNADAGFKFPGRGHHHGSGPHLAVLSAHAARARRAGAPARRAAYDRPPGGPAVPARSRPPRPRPRRRRPGEELARRPRGRAPPPPPPRHRPLAPSSLRHRANPPSTKVVVALRETASPLRDICADGAAALTAPFRLPPGSARDGQRAGEAAPVPPHRS